MLYFLKKYWFMAGLLLVFLVTVLDTTQAVSRTGQWVQRNNGPSMTIFLIFLLSGLILRTHDIRTGATDVTGLVIALVIGFVAAPALALLLGFAPLPAGVIIGLFLVAVMPSTLSSGVVMTGAAGGNMAHALLITIVANSLAVVTIPISLSMLLRFAGNTQEITIDNAAIMFKIGALVLLPLAGGLALKSCNPELCDRGRQSIQTATQVLILAIVWMGLSQTREAIITSVPTMGLVMVLTAVFHGCVLGVAIGFSRWFKLPKGRRESVIFMGSQKTLPLSIVLQVSLFPQYPLALMVCVIHHLVHLFMDGYMVTRIKSHEA